MWRYAPTSAFLAAVLLSPAGAAKPSSTESLDIGARRELFVDRFLIDELNGTTLKMHVPQPAPPVSSPRPHGDYATVLRDGDSFRAYYRDYTVPGSHWRNGWEQHHRAEVTLCAESDDALHWKLVDYGIASHPTFPAGNIVLNDQWLVSHNFTPFIDTRPGVPTGERYKGIGGLNYGEKRAALREQYGPGGLKAYVSADGIHWKLLRDEAVIPEAWGMFDSQNVAFWSDSEGTYVCYYRLFVDGRRSIGRATSPDFLNWTNRGLVQANLPGEELYVNGTQPYFRAPHLYVALPTRFVGKRGAATDIALMSSRGGSRFERTFPESFIRPGLGDDGWADRANYAALGIHQTGPTEMSLFLTRGRRFTLRLDGFASVNAPFAGGEMTTKPLTFAGEKLEINYSTSAAGSIRVEVQDAAGKPLPDFALDHCEPIYGDHIARIVKWKNGPSLKPHAGSVVNLRFAMEDADLFSIRFVADKTESN